MSKEKFYFIDDNNNKISAGGLLPYRYNTTTNEYEFLMIKYFKNNVPYYSDFGGCVDKSDCDIYMTIARETNEESNGIFKLNKVYKNLQNGYYLFNIKSKYVVILCLINVLTKKQIDCTMFGNIEYHDNIKRTVEWIPLHLLCNSSFKNHLNYRLRFYNFFKQIYQLQKE